MEETSQNIEGKNYQELENARLGYQTAVHLFSLASQEFYSRFAAMLIAHALLLTVVFKYPAVDRCVVILASSAGIFMCFLWLLMVKQPLASQDYYSKKATELEENFCNKFRIFSRKGCPDCELESNIARESKYLKKISVKLRIGILSCTVIVIFVVVYSIMLCKILN